MTLFGELFWRDHLINSQQTPSGIPAYSKWIPSGLPANSKWIPVDSQRTPGEIPANSCQTPNGHPPDFQQISSKVDSKQVSIQRAHFESFFGEPILRAALETDSISWGNGGFPTDTQQSPNGWFLLTTMTGNSKLCPKILSPFFHPIVVKYD